jgi:hypothetical protein
LNLPVIAVILAACMALTAASASAADCAAIYKQAQEKELRRVPVSSHRVIGAGRLHFHTAPDAACRDAKLFVIPGDKLTVYTEYQGYVSVMYLNPKAGEDFMGWVEAKRLEFVGTLAPGK